jgi:uncharacterized membrane protein
MKTTWRTELPQWLLLTAMFAGAAVAWPSAPARFPMHWDLAGEVDRFGGRFEGLLAIPLLALGLHLLMRFLPQVDPGRANYASFVSAYTAARVSVLALLAFLWGVIQLAARGRRIDVGAVVPLAVGALFVVLGSLMGKIRPNWFFGVRTPWTLSSAEAWTKTHRAGGWAFIGAGLATMAASLLGTPMLTFGVLIGSIVAAALGLSVYSYLVWRGDPDRIPPAGRTPA